MADNKFNFTKAGIARLPTPPKGKRAYYYDTKTRGLCVSVTDKGTKSFLVYRKVNGRPERITLGRCSDLSIEEARGGADEVNSTIAKGKNPQDKKRAIREEMTIGELFDLYLERHAKDHKKSWKGDEGQYNRYLTRWRNKKLSSVRKIEVQTLHAKIAKDKGPYAANRLLALLHTMFNKAIDWGWEKSNPTSGIQRFRERSRERFLEADELPRFFESLSLEPDDTIKDYVIISLLTGARRANVTAMQWDQINLERGTWTIPDTKNGTQHTIPLVLEAATILQNRMNNESDYVFPGRGQSGHMMEPKKGWKRILDRANIKDLRIHDLRRTLGSWQAATGANLSVIGKTLAHKNVSTTAIYARLNLDPVRKSMETATSAMMLAGGLVDNTNVKELKRENK